MPHRAIRVNHLSKQYRIGVDRRYKALRDTLTDLLYAPFRAAARMASGVSHDPGGDTASATGALTRPARRAEQETIWALRDVSFEVAAGEVVGIIGRNGAGKSTLLKILSRITEPTEGTVELYGRVGSLLEVGTGFHPELTGRENIYLNGAILGMKRGEIARKFDEIVAFAEVERFLDTPVKYYSSGMYMRLAFAVAAHLEPEILLVDEVLAVGDAAFQKKCLGKMGEVTRAGRTVLLVSHQMAAIERVCSRCIVLDMGKVQFTGPPSMAIPYYLQEVARNVAQVDIRSMFRTGNGQVRLTGFFLEDEHGKPTMAAAMGRPITFVFNYESHADRASAMSFGFSIHTVNGDAVTVLYSDYQGIHFDNLGLHGSVRFTIPKLALTSGKYYVCVRILLGGVEADWPRGYVGSFEVEGGDFYGEGRGFHSGQGIMLIEGSWQHASGGVLHAGRRIE